MSEVACSTQQQLEVEHETDIVLFPQTQAESGPSNSLPVIGKPWRDKIVSITSRYRYVSAVAVSMREHGRARANCWNFRLEFQLQKVSALSNCVRATAIRCNAKNGPWLYVWLLFRARQPLGEFARHGDRLEHRVAISTEG